MRSEGEGGQEDLKFQAGEATERYEGAWARRRGGNEMMGERKRCGEGRGEGIGEEWGRRREDKGEGRGVVACSVGKADKMTPSTLPKPSTSGLWV